MNCNLMVYGKKLFSIALIFNSLVSIVCIIELLYGFYKAAPYWLPFSPYLIDGNFLWIILMAALVNIYPVSSIGRPLKLGRFLFHHYVYGLIVLLIAIFGVIVFMPVSFLNLFIIETSDIAINAARFFILGGLALLLDDLPDTSQWVEARLNWLKTKAYQLRKLIHCLQLCLSAVLIYLLFTMTFWVIHNPQWLNIGNIILIGTISITTVTTIVLAKRKFWLHISIKEK